MNRKAFLRPFCLFCGFCISGILLSCNSVSPTSFSLATASSLVERGAHPTLKQNEARRLEQEVANALDHVAAHLEQWGTLSISSPLPDSEGDDFVLDLNLDAKEDLFHGDRAEGAVLLRELSAMGASINARDVGGSSTKSLFGGSQDRRGDATSANETVEGEGGVFPDPVPAPGTDQVAKWAATQPADLGTPEIALRRRIRLAASDNAELGLHRFLSDPKNLPEGSEAYFFVFTVSCRPGWRSRAGYAGVVDVGLEYLYKGQPITGGGAFHPNVVGMYPAFDSQELNLHSARQQAIDLAAQLAVIGQVSAARLLVNYAHRLEETAETATGLTQVTAYSQGGRNFGYEFRPAFRALAQPGSKERKPGYRLEPTAFPAVAVVTVNREEIKSALLEYFIDQIASTQAFKEVESQATKDIRATALPDVKSSHSEKTKIFQSWESLRQAVSHVVAIPTPRIAPGLSQEQFAKLVQDKENLDRYRRRKHEYVSVIRAWRLAVGKDKGLWKASYKVLIDPIEEIMKNLDEEVEHVQVAFHATHSWRPLVGDGGTRDYQPPARWWFGLNRPGTPRLPETAILKLQAEMSNARNLLTELQFAAAATGDTMAANNAASLDKRMEMLEAQGFNLSPYIEFSPFAEVETLEVTSISSKAAAVGNDVLVHLEGQGFPPIKNGTSLNGNPHISLVALDGGDKVPDASVVVASPTDVFVRVAGSDGQAGWFVFRLKSGDKEVYSSSLRFVEQQDNTEKAAASSGYTVRIERQDGRVVGVTLPSEEPKNGVVHPVNHVIRILKALYEGSQDDSSTNKAKPKGVE